jgi:CTP synthase
MERFNARKGKVRIGIVGKYMELHDAYKSLYEALFHAGLECGVDVELVKIDSSRLKESENIDAVLGCNGTNHVDGILVPGGPGPRGINGMVKAAAWARMNKVPYFGICLGMNVMAIDWARNVMNWGDADSAEFNRDSKHPVVDLYNGGTMRLGASESVIQEGSHIFAAYGEKHIWERHRHRYEFSNQYRDEMSGSGLKITALTPDNNLVECIEWPDHPWGLGVQFNPEYKSKPTAAAPLFRDFIAAVKKSCG